MTKIRKIQFLVVEDNEMNFSVLEAFLKMYPCEITHAWDGVEAIEAFKKAQPHIILMDIAMPNMDGITATKAIRAYEKSAHLARTPISAFTAFVTGEDRTACFDAGMDYFFEKPVTSDRFDTFLEKVIPGIVKIGDP